MMMVSLGMPTARAQAPPPLPSTIPLSPTVVGREVLDERTAPTAKSDVTVETPGALKVPPELAGRQVEFHHIMVEGAAAYTSGDFVAIFSPVLNRRVAFSEIVAAANRLSALYEREGYVFYAVMLPQQDLDGDTLRVVVVEGSISAIEIDATIASEAVRRRIADLLAPLRGKHPLRRAQLERQLLLAADTPGVALQASAKATGNPAEVTLVVKGTFERFQPIGQVDSLQTSPDAQMNFRVGALERSLLIGGDQLEARYLFSLPWDRLQLLDLRYGLPVGTDGGRLSFLAQAVWQRPVFTVNGQAVDFVGRSLLGRVQYAYPLVRSLKWTVSVFGMFDVIETDYTLAGLGIPGDALRVTRAGLSTQFKDDWKGMWNASMLASLGLDAAGAMANNRAGAGPSFAKINLSLERAQPIGKDFALVVRAAAQETTGTVPAAEVFSFGGRDFGRAFFVAEAVSDRGAAVSAELRYAIDWLGIPSDKVAPHLYVFADHGWLSSVNTLNAPLFQEASTAGGGLRVRAFQKYTAELEFARALETPPAGDPPWRISFRVGTAF
jgi:hemolysin activation/secretion protein